MVANCNHMHCPTQKAKRKRKNREHKSENVMINQDYRARNTLERTIKQHPDVMYEAGLVWENNDVKLHDSYKIAHSRLICFESQLKREPEL